MQVTAFAEKQEIEIRRRQTIIFHAAALDEREHLKGLGA
jgi:hypothetical protein